MSEQDYAAPADDVQRGRTTVSARALQHLATAVAKDAARVPARDVSVSLSDDEGALRVTVVAPVELTTPALTIPEQSERLRDGLIDGLRSLAGRSVGSVDVRFSGVHRNTQKGGFYERS